MEKRFITTHTKSAALGLLSQLRSDTCDAVVELLSSVLHVDPERRSTACEVLARRGCIIEAVVIDNRVCNDEDANVTVDAAKCDVCLFNGGSFTHHMYHQLKTVRCLYHFLLYPAYTGRDL